MLRGFAHTDHERGIDLLYRPDGRAEADPAKEPCSVYTGEFPTWWIEDDPDFEFTLTDGTPRKGMRVGGDGAGPLLGDEIVTESKAAAKLADSGKGN